MIEVCTKQIRAFEICIAKSRTVEITVTKDYALKVCVIKVGPAEVWYYKIILIIITPLIPCFNPLLQNLKALWICHDSSLR